MKLFGHPSPQFCLTAWIAVGVCAHLTAQNRYTVQGLGPIGNSVFSEPQDRISLNANGQAAGFMLDTAGATYRAISVQGSVITDLGTLGGDPAAKAHAISDSGVIVGTSGTANTAGGASPFTARRAFSRAGGVLVDLGLASSAAFGINSAGVIVGDTTSLRPFVFSNGQLRELTINISNGGGRARAVNARGEIVGSVRAAQPGGLGVMRAYRWTQEVPFDLGTLGGTAAAAEAINDAGQIVGWSTTAENETHAFLYDGGIMRDLGGAGGEGHAVAINLAGHVVGWSRLSTGSRAFLHEGDRIVDLVTIAPVRTGTAAGMVSYTYATAINNRGQIAGIGSYVATAGATAMNSGFVLTPVVEVYPPIATVAAGTPVALSAKSALPATNYQWRRNDVAVAGATAATLLIPAATSATALANYSCLVTTASGAYVSAPVPVRIEAATDSPSRLVNLSIRSLAGSGDNTLIIGFAAGGAGASGTKPLLVRASGPALASFGVTGTLADPSLTIFQGNTAVASNDNWGGAEAINSAVRSVGAFLVTDPQSRDAAIYRSDLPAGTYSVHVTGSGGATGTVLAEIYDASAQSTTTAARLFNVSARNQVGTGDRILIAGFVVGGNSGRTLLIRGIGPGLTPYGVTGVLADPKLELHQGSALLASNDNWSGNATLRTAAANTGAFELPDATSRDAALLVTLAPGAYTVQLSGADGGTGVGLLEIYELP